MFFFLSLSLCPSLATFLSSLSTYSSSWTSCNDPYQHIHQQHIRVIYCDSYPINPTYWCNHQAIPSLHLTLSTHLSYLHTYLNNPSYPVISSSHLTLLTHLLISPCLNNPPSYHSIPEAKRLADIKADHDAEAKALKDTMMIYEVRLQLR